jgi:hypothetical protein
MSTRSDKFRIPRQRTHGTYIGSTPKRRAQMPSPAVTLAALALFFALGGTMVHAHGGDAQAIHACVNNATGEVTLLSDNTGYGNPNSRCQRPNEQHALDWNVAGPPGSQGAPGPQGAAGPPGPAGPPGKASKTAAINLPWYETKAGWVSFRGSKELARLKVPSGATYFVNAMLVGTAHPVMDLNCQMLSYNATGSKLVSWVFFGAGAPRGINPVSASGYSRTEHVQTMSAHDLIEFPAARGTLMSRILVRCRVADYSVAPFTASGKASIGNVRVSALMIGGRGR